MSKFHVNPETGKVSQCRATGDGCPFGGETGTENHYESAAEAQSAYEKQMEGHALPSTQKPTSHISATELNAQAKTSADFKVQMAAAGRGSTRVLNSLASNPRAFPMALKAAFDRTESESTRLKLIDNSGYPIDTLPADRLKALASSSAEGQQRVVALDERNNVDDIVAEKLVAAGHHRSITNFYNEVSMDKRIELADKLPDASLIARVSNTPLTDPENLKKFSANANYALLGALRNPDSVRVAYERVQAETDQTKITADEKSRADDSVLRNRSTPSDVIDRVVESRSKGNTLDSFTASAVFKHPNVSPAAKEKALNAPGMAGVKALEGIKAESPAAFASLESAIGSYTTPLRSRQRRVRLNPYAVRDLKMTDEQVRDYVTHYQNTALFQSTYNRETGEYIGYTS